MNVGLPGTGIGGLFYLGTALAMPFAELVTTLQGRSSVARWRSVLAHAAMAAAILAVLYVSGLLLFRALEGTGSPPGLLDLFGGDAASASGGAHERAKAAGQQLPAILTLATLTAVLLLVEALHFAARVGEGEGRGAGQRMAYALRHAPSTGLAFGLGGLGLVLGVLLIG